MIPQQPIFNPTYINLEYFFYKILEILRAIYAFISGVGALWLAIILSILGGLFVIVIIYSYLKKKEIEKREHMEMMAILTRQPAATPKNERWEEVLKHRDSQNPSDWRVAIIEADAMLDEMVTRMRIPGDNLGDRLKRVDRADFKSLDDAWEAHKIRNQIAHEGTAFALSHDETRRIILLYEKVFKEFKFI
jgi:hypothetical protein